jgi:hypothetical protein
MATPLIVANAILLIGLLAPLAWFGFRKRD